MKYTDKDFYNACLYGESKSRCLSRHIGAVLGKDGDMLITGWNGPPKGVPACNAGWYFDITAKLVNKCPRQDMGHKSGEGVDECIAVHAERSALINAARCGLKTEGLTMYMSCGVPCSPCLVEIMDAGIAEIVCTDVNGYYDKRAEYLANQAKLNGMKIRVFDFMESDNG